MAVAWTFIVEIQLVDLVAAQAQITDGHAASLRLALDLKHILMREVLPSAALEEGVVVILGARNVGLEDLGLGGLI